MKRKIFFKSIFLVTLIIVMNFSMAYAISFSDIAGHWAESSIISLAENEIINGYPDGTFVPQGEIKKGEFMKLIMTASMPDTVWEIKESNYSHWSGAYITMAEKKHVIDENIINDYNANEPITRGEVVEILGKCDIMLKKTGQEVTELNFTDISTMTNEQQAMLKHAVATGLINGYPNGTFMPGGTLTRAEVATILVRYLAK